MSKNTDTANDYALAKILNDRVINIFTMVVDNRSTPDLSAVNRSYILMVDELKQIYDRQPELKKLGGGICWRVLDNLEQAHEFVPAIEFTHSGGDYGEAHNSSVSRLCIKTGKKIPDLTPEIKTIIDESDKNVATFKAELDKMYAKLSFESMVVPVVTIGDTKYYLKPMRDGLAYNVVSFCLAKHPDQEVNLNDLKAEMKKAGISVFGLINFNNDTSKSIFGKNNALSPFMTTSPKSIRVRKTTNLTDQQIAIIAETSTKISE